MSFEYFKLILLRRHFPPFNSIPNTFVEKISDGSVCITDDHKAQRYLYLACKKINGREIERQNYDSVADCLGKRSFQRFIGMMFLENCGEHCCSVNLSCQIFCF